MKPSIGLGNTTWFVAHDVSVSPKWRTIDTRRQIKPQKRSRGVTPQFHWNGKILRLTTRGSQRANRKTATPYTAIVRRAPTNSILVLRITLSLCAAFSAVTQSQGETTLLVLYHRIMCKLLQVNTKSNHVGYFHQVVVRVDNNNHVMSGHPTPKTKECH